MRHGAAAVHSQVDVASLVRRFVQFLGELRADDVRRREPVVVRRPEHEERRHLCRRFPPDRGDRAPEQPVGVRRERERHHARRLPVLRPRCPVRRPCHPARRRQPGAHAGIPRPESRPVHVRPGGAGATQSAAGVHVAARHGSHPGRALRLPGGGHGPRRRQLDLLAARRPGRDVGRSGQRQGDLEPRNRATSAIKTCCSRCPTATAARRGSSYTITTSVAPRIVPRCSPRRPWSSPMSARRTPTRRPPRTRTAIP